MTAVTRITELQFQLQLPGEKKYVLTILSAAAVAAEVLAQGPLTPPGAPAPVMKTLEPIEPRIPVSSLPFTISQPGGYYLAGNLQYTAATGDAITIASNDVTLARNSSRVLSRQRQQPPEQREHGHRQWKRTHRQQPRTVNGHLKSRQMMKTLGPSGSPWARTSSRPTSPASPTACQTKGPLRLTGVERINQGALRRHAISVSNPAANNTIAPGSGTTV
jgi:hypothetical protein